MRDQIRTQRYTEHFMEGTSGYKNLKNIVNTLDACESKTEILHLVCKDPYIASILEGKDESECVQELNQLLVNVEGSGASYEPQINIDLSKYERLYDNFDEAHNREHMNKVRKFAVYLGRTYAPDYLDLIYIAATLHDIGLIEDRESHEEHGGMMIRNDEYLNSVLTAEQIDIVASAVEQHRASTGNQQSNIEKIISDADRASNTTSFILYRSIMYQLKNEYERGKSLNQYIVQVVDYLRSKFGPEGFGKKLHFPESEKKLENTMEPILSAQSTQEIWELLRPSHQDKILDRYNKIHKSDPGASVSLESFGSPVYGYTYVPENTLNTVLKNGLKSAVQLYKETGNPAYLEKYRSSTAEHFDIPEEEVTPDLIIKHLTEIRKEMGPEGANAVYLLPGTIPEGISEELDKFRQRPVIKAELNSYEDKLYAVETREAGYMEVKIGLEDVMDLQDEFRRAWTSKEYRDRKNPELLFSKIPHLVIVGGIKPEHLSKVE